MSRRRPPNGLQPRAVAPESTDTPLPPQKTRQHGWLGRKLVRGFAMLVVFLSFGLAFITSQEAPASAAGIDVECAITAEFSGRGPESPGGGVEGFFSPGPTSESGMADYEKKLGITNWTPGNHTLYEAYGVRGATWSTSEWYQQDDYQSKDGGNEDEKRCDFMGQVMTSTAQLIFDLDRIITSSVISLRQTATDATPFLEVVRTMTDEISLMSENVWRVGAGIMIIVTGIWVLMKWNNRDRSQREIVQGLLWIVCAIIGVGFLLAPSHAANGPNYLWVAEKANETTHKALSDLSELLLADGEETGPCALETGTERGMRTLDCSVYETLVFDVWVQGQYGGPGNQEAIPYKPVYNDGGDTIDDQLPDGTDMRIAQLRAQALSYDEAYGGADWSLGTDSGDEAHKETDPDTKSGQWNLIRLSYFQNYHDNYKSWKGEEANARLAAAFGGFIASILVGVFIAATSLITMVWNAVPVVLLIALPIVGTISIFPPWQKFLRGWAQTWIKATILGLVFGVAQMLSLIAVDVTLSSGLALGWKCLVMIVLVLALWKVVQAAREDAFTPDMGGDASMWDGDTWGRDAIRHSRTAASKARGATRSAPARVLGGAVAGASVGGMLGGKSAVQRGLARASEGQAQRTASLEAKFREDHGREPSEEEKKKLRRRASMSGKAAAIGGGARDVLAGTVKGGTGGAAEGLSRRHRNSMMSGARGAKRAMDKRDERISDRTSRRAADRDSANPPPQTNPSARANGTPARRPRRGQPR